MKGDVSPVVYIVAAVVIVVLILAILFLLGVGPFSGEASASFCKSQILKACGRYEISGNTKEFENVSPGCENALKDQSIRSAFRSCRNSGSDSGCYSLCEWIKSGG